MRQAFAAVATAVSLALATPIFSGCGPASTNPQQTPWATFTPLVAAPPTAPDAANPQPPALPPFLPDPSKLPAKLHEITTGKPTKLIFTPDSKRLLAISYDEKTFTCFDVATGAKLDEISTPARPTDFALTPDGRKVFGVDVNQTIGHIALGEDGKFSAKDRWPAQVGHTAGIAVSHDGKLVVATSHDKIVTIFDAASGAEKARLTSADGVRDAVFSPTAPLLVVSGTGNHLFFLDLAKGHATSEFIPAVSPDSDAATIAVSNDGKFAITGHMDTSIVVWDMASRKPLHNFFVRDASCMGVAFSADSTRFLTVQSDGKARIYDTATGKILAALDAHSPSAACVATAPDNATFATGGDDGKIIIWR